jgi:endonuclease I
VVTIASNASQYYQSISPSLSGEALKNALDLLISANVRVGYDWSRFESADESLTQTNKIITIYPRRDYLKTAHVSGNAAAHWNREHTYPQSKISGNAVNDNHHIFADDWKTNGTRSNLRFGDVSNLESNRVKDSSNLATENFTANGFFEPNDVAKGEVARATLYLNTLYGYAIDGNFQTTELAVLWALQYPISNRDMQRNNRVYTNQGNRNPYVDHASYICLVYGMTSVATQQACGLA